MKNNSLKEWQKYFDNLNKEDSKYAERPSERKHEETTQNFHSLYKRNLIQEDNE